MFKPKEHPQNENLKKVKNEEVNDGVVTVSVLPPALKALVLIWEELSTTCRRAIEQQTLLPSPSLPARIAKNVALNREKGAGQSKIVELSKEKPEGKRTSRKKKEWKPMGRLNALGEASGLAVSFLGAGGERETVCELCGGIFPHPVTYHMRQSHPGCGGHAGGKGYNSSGNFCVGWAGHCGDGGVGGCSWYLVCDTCRDKFIRSKKDGNPSGKEKKKSSGKKKALVVTPVTSVSKLLSPVFSHSNSVDAHIVMRDNAMFLLDLASAASPGMPRQQRRSVSGMPSVSENYSPPEPPGPFSPVGPFQCLQALGCHLHEQELQDLMQRQPPQEMDASFNGNPQPNSRVNTNYILL